MGTYAPCADKTPQIGCFLSGVFGCAFLDPAGGKLALQVVGALLRLRKCSCSNVFGVFADIHRRWLDHAYDGAWATPGLRLKCEHRAAGKSPATLP